MMTKKYIIFIVLGALSVVIILPYFILPWFYKLRSTKNPDFYRAAVVEVAPIFNKSMPIMDVIRKTLDIFHSAASLASQNEVDLIVFPECALYFDVDDYQVNRSALMNTIANDIPNPADDDYNPCNQEHKFTKHFLLQNLSCMAKSNSLYIVANMVDYKRCKDSDNLVDKDDSLNCSDKKNCPDDGFYFYNVNVVFDRAGKLIKRYHKKHLFWEPAMNNSNCPDDGFFETDFGNFTAPICFDLLFKQTTDAIEQTKADNLAYTYSWIDHMPLFFFANFYQQSYSHFHKINLLAANTHIPEYGSLGSGIFSASSGALISTHQPDGRTKLLITDVPKYPKSLTVPSVDLYKKRYEFYNEAFNEASIEDTIEHENQCEETALETTNYSLKDYRCWTLNLTDYKFKKLVKVEDTLKVCSESLCCELSYKADSIKEDYFLAVQARRESIYELNYYNTETCFLTRCKSENGLSCSSFYLKSNTVFEEVELKGTFSTTYNYPLSIDSNIRFTSKEKWTFDGKSQIVYKNENKNSSLLYFGLSGKQYID